ncbi:hypothetical protein BD770DRAFT_408085 [Pilaira anomala]|nr:hypothetical protein BD770DRAFT_408085 [Pilaira anomala]
MKNYILLENIKRADITEVRYSLRHDKRSWYISYNKDENSFFCRNLLTNKGVIMKNVESFIQVWIDNMNIRIKNKREDEVAKISLFVRGKYFSGYKCTFDHEISKNTGNFFADTLKDIIGELEADKKTPPPPK